MSTLQQPDDQEHVDDEREFEDSSLFDNSDTSDGVDNEIYGQPDGLLARSLEYEAQSVHLSDPLKACMCELNAGQIRIAKKLQDSIEEVMSSEPMSIEFLERVTKPNAVLQVTLRQIEKYAEFIEHVDEPRSRFVPLAGSVPRRARGIPLDQYRLRDRE